MIRETFISLSAIPPRFPFLRPILQSLVDQQGTTAPVLLFIPESYRRFPDWDGTLPSVPPGVTILRCPKDEGPATKLLPALRHFAGQDVNILFCDDDNLYPPDWLAGFRRAASDNRNAAICMHGAELNSLQGYDRPSHRLPRAQRWDVDELSIYLSQHQPPLPLGRPLFRTSGYVDILYGRGGVLVRPEFFDATVFDPPPVIWAVDDYWLSGHLEMRNVPIWVDHRIPNPLTHPSLDLIRPLLRDTIEKHDRWDANRVCVDWYRREKGIWHPGAPDETAPARNPRKGRKPLAPQKPVQRPQRKPLTLWQRLKRRFSGR